MEKTEKQLDHLKEGLQKLNGQARTLEDPMISAAKALSDGSFQELRPRSATANPAPCSPRCGRFNAQQWLQLPGAPWTGPWLTTCLVRCFIIFLLYYIVVFVSLRDDDATASNARAALGQVGRKRVGRGNKTAAPKLLGELPLSPRK